MKKIILTGGGTAGHVTPNIAIIPKLKELGYEINYIGSKDGIEKRLIENENIPYYGISTGKLRRYLSKENVSDMFKVVSGITEASKIIKKLKPDIIFSKGGFVSVPVVLGAKLHRVPIVIHESDITSGLANKIAIPFAKAVCVTFEEALHLVPRKKSYYTGTPIRKELFEGNRDKGLKMCNFTGKKPVVMMMGGSLGSVKINNCLYEALDTILKDFDLVHICGKGNLKEKFKNKKGYKQFEYISEGLSDIFAMADIIISRAGSNSISEFLALKKPSLLIPLSRNASRGDQILNALSFERKGYSSVIKEEDMTAEKIIEGINTLYKDREKFISNMEKGSKLNGVEEVIKVIQKYTK